MRKSYLDNIRWMTVVLVVLYHVFYMYNGEGVLGGLGKITGLEHQYYDVYQYAVYPWCMLLLFLVAGISARYYLDHHTEREFIRSRTRKLLVPSTIGLLVFQFIQGYVSMSLAGAMDQMKAVPAAIKYLIMAMSGVGVLWFIQLLWVLSLVLVVVRKIEKDRLWHLGERTNVVALVLLTALIWLAAQVLNTPVVIVYRFGLYGTVFLLGYFVFSHDKVIEILKKWFPAFLGVGVLLGAIFCITRFGENYAEVPINRSILFTSYGWFSCLAILGGMARYGDISNRFTRWMGKRSYGLYVFHYLCISSVALFIGSKGVVPAPAVYGISLIAGFTGGLLLGELISRIPFFRWAILGISKSK